MTANGKSHQPQGAARRVGDDVAAQRRAERRARQAAQYELARREKARRDLLSFCQYIDNAYQTAPHLVMLAEMLVEVERYILTKGEEGIGRLIVTMPPRHGKSETISKRWPAFLLGKHHRPPDYEPDEDEPERIEELRIALLAYGDELARDFSNANRKLVKESREYHQLFPGANLHRQSGAINQWSLADTDIDDPSIVATGIGGPLIGRGFQLIVIDDPIKLRKEAESPTYRENVHGAYKGSIRERLEPGGAIVIVMTRWHEDDLVARLIQQDEDGEGEGWWVLNLPAMAEEDDPLDREPGAALWPERYPVDELEKTKTAIGSYEWEAKYMGRPSSPEGGRIKRAWLEVIPPIDRNVEANIVWVRYWDLAATVKTASSFTASMRMGLWRNGDVYHTAMVRGKWEWPDQIRVMKQTMLAEMHLNVIHGVEAALHGHSMIQALMADPDLMGVTIVGISPEGDKLTRALPWIARAEAGHVKLIQGAWIDEFINEAVNFSGHNDAHDDQIDTVSGGLNMLWQLHGGDTDDAPRVEAIY